MVIVTVTLTSSEVERVQQATSALWPDEINNGRLSRSEIIRRFTWAAGTELLARLSDQERRALEEEFIDSVSSPNGFRFRGRLPRG